MEINTELLKTEYDALWIWRLLIILKPTQPVFVGGGFVLGEGRVTFSAWKLVESPKGVLEERKGWK